MVHRCDVEGCGRDSAFKRVMETDRSVVVVVRVCPNHKEIEL